VSTPSNRRRGRVLIVDDDAALGDTLVEELGNDGFDPVYIRDSREAERRIGEDFVALLTDLRMPGVDGLALLARSRAAAPDRPVIVMTAFSAVDTAIESIRQGAYHYLTKPFKVDELVLFLDRALAEARLRDEAGALRKALSQVHAIETIVGQNGAMRDVCALVLRVADAATPVLVHGETGSGKDLVARALHQKSRRAPYAFVTINCAAMPEALLESELFGHVRGAFTGATTTRPGLFEEAKGGTIFLDEIGEMPLGLQAKLLHVLERGVVRAVGANKEKAIDVRIVAATHRDLRRQVALGTFREDLLFRLDVIRLEVPPLRERGSDLPELVAHFFAQARKRHPTSKVERLSPAAFDRLAAHTWPGNVRELANLVERLVLTGVSEEVGVRDLPPSLLEPQTEEQQYTGQVQSLESLNRSYARWALARCEGRKGTTAELLDIDRKTLARLLGEPPRD
jgi:two-component system response regulator HydG